MRIYVLPITAILICFTGSGLLAQNPSRYQLAMEKLDSAKSKRDRFYSLAKAAKESFINGHIVEAKQLSLELLSLAPRFTEDWNYGNAIHDGNMVLGRIAVLENNIPEAINFLMKAGNTPGSPGLNSFGPNMSLAKDLLEKGEKNAVLDYFKLCSKFWSFHQDYLDQWTSEINSNRVPDFKGNLIY